MKFVFFGYDYSLNIAERLIADGHTLLYLFTFPCDGAFTFNDNLHALAQDLNIPVFEGKATPEHIQNCLRRDASLFIAAGYLYKIPPIDETKAYALNLHPSFLPKARGIMPLPHIIMNEPEAAGFSIHKMTDTFDDGAILYQEKINLTPETDVEILSAQISMRSPGAVSTVASDITRLWQNAKPQDKAQATSIPAPDEKMRTLDWDQSVDYLSKKGRAFGRYGMIAHIQSQDFVVFNFKCWKEEHQNMPGDVLLAGPREITIAVRDGYICLKEFQLLPSS